MYLPRLVDDEHARAKFCDSQKVLELLLHGLLEHH
jgi:hypothetical protein